MRRTLVTLMTVGVLVGTTGSLLAAGGNSSGGSAAKAQYKRKPCSENHQFLDSNGDCVFCPPGYRLVNTIGSGDQCLANGLWNQPRQTPPRDKPFPRGWNGNPPPGAEGNPNH